jgi:hypothetical protein
MVVMLQKCKNKIFSEKDNIIFATLAILPITIFIFFYHAS